MKTKAQRRHDAERIKAKTKRKLKVWWYRDREHELDNKVIGRQAAMHCTHICKMCHAGWDEPLKFRLAAHLKINVEDEV